MTERLPDRFRDQVAARTWPSSSARLDNRSRNLMSRMLKALPALANALNLTSMELGANLGLTVMVIRFATEDYAERLVASAVSEPSAVVAVSAFHSIPRSMAPGGTTFIERDQVEGLLPGFRESMANGISFSLWLVTAALLVANVLAAVLFRWARGRDERPASPIQVVPPGLPPQLPGAS